MHKMLLVHNGTLFLSVWVCHWEYSSQQLFVMHLYYMSALLSRDGSREGHRGQCSSFLNHIWEANTTHSYVTAQFKLDICMHMLEKFLKKIHEILMSSMWAVYTCFMLHTLVGKLYIVCSRSPEPSFSLNNFSCIHLVATNYISLWSPSNAGIVKIKSASIQL